MPAGINLIGFSGNLTHALWGFSNPAWIDYTPGTHDGPLSGSGKTAGTVHFFGPGPAQEGMRTHIPVPDDGLTRNCSTYIRKVSATPSRYPVLRAKYEAGGALVLAYVLIDTENGVIYPSVDYPPDDSGIVAVGSDWLRVWFDVTNDNSGNTSLEFAYYPCWSDDLDPDTLGPSGNASIVVWGPQSTEGAGILDYMATPNYGRAIEEYRKTRGYY